MNGPIRTARESNQLSGLPREVVAALRLHASTLQSLIEPDEDLGIAGAAFAMYLPQPEVAARVQSDQKLTKGDYPLAAFLQAQPDPNHPRFADLQKLRALTLLAALKFLADNRKDEGREVDDRHPTIDFGLRAVRRLCTVRSLGPMRRELPVIPDRMLRAADALRDWRNRLRRRRDDYAARLEEICRLIDYLPYDRTTRDYAARQTERAAEDLPRFAWRITAAIDDSDVPAARFWAPPEGLTVRDGPRDRAEAADLLEETDVDLGFSPGPVDALCSDFEDQRELFAERSNVSAWLADTGSLADAECRTIIEAAHAEMQSPAPDPGAVLCAASLLFGRRIEALARLSREEGRPGRAWWSGVAVGYCPDLPDAGKKSSNGLLALAPASWRAAMDGVLACGQPASGLKQQARQWLSRLPDLRPTRLTSLARALADGLKARGEDAAVIGLLTGQSVEDLTQLYYASFPVERLQTAWRMHQAERLGCPPALVACLEPVGRSRQIGSRRAPSAAQVNAWFASLAAEWDRWCAPGVQRWSMHWPDRHAAATQYCAAALSLMAARRPHGPAFEPFGGICGRQRPRIMVSDKGNRILDDARWLPVPPIGQRIVAGYHQHLHALIDAIGTLVPCGSLALAEAARAGQGAPFFAIPSLETAAEPLTAAVFWDRLGSPAATPRNWARHFMRRELAAAGLSGHRIDSYMGHGGSWSDPLAPESMDSLAAQDELNAALEQIMTRALGPLPMALR